MLGEKILNAAAGRDCIHIAIAPVIAAYRLSPGQDVGLNEKGEADPNAMPFVGIIDPFLKTLVMPGQRVYLCLYPNTVTAMRHHWSHPAFDEPAPPPPPPRDVATSRAWIETFCERVGVEYDELLERASDYQEHDSYWSEGGRFEGEYIPEEFWDHYQVVTGKLANDRSNFFSCSC